MDLQTLRIQNLNNQLNFHIILDKNISLGSRLYKNENFRDKKLNMASGN